jgi:hypothetical protein
LLEGLEPRRLLSTYYVDNTNDNGTGSLRAAIIAANADTSPGTDEIDFDIPAQVAGEPSTPVPGFDPGTQDWTITLASPLPVITRPVSIDGYTEGDSGGEPYLYPDSTSSAVQSLAIQAVRPAAHSPCRPHRRSPWVRRQRSLTMPTPAPLKSR